LCPGRRKRRRRELAELAYSVEALFKLEPDEQLRVFIRIMLQRMLDPGKPAWHGRLMAREMIEPTDALERLVHQFIRPKKEILTGIVRRVMGAKVPQDVVDACARSVIGQGLFYHHNRPVIQLLYPHLGYSPDGVKRLAEHIAEFSLSAMRELRDRQEGTA
jgi:TetR/AcrR family transcriptional regulator, regulator of cefoperazone and chloramphenicol sensitivity